MSGKDDDFLAELRATFRVEAAEHLQTITAGLLELEKASSEDAEGALVETVFRSAHSLKGAARAVDWSEIEMHCESLEDTFSGWRRNGGPREHGELDSLYRMLDAASAALAAPAAPLAAPAAPNAGRVVASPAAPAAPDALADAAAGRRGVPADRADPASESSAPVVARERREVPGERPEATPLPDLASPSTATATEATVRIPVSKLDARLVKAEEMLGIKLATRQRVDDLQALRERFDACCREWTAAEAKCRVLRYENAAGAVASAPAVAQLLDFVDHHSRELRSLEAALAAIARVAARDHQAVGQSIDELLTDSRQLLRLPMSSVTAALPKLVRDLCRDQGKEADLLIQGDELDLDKRILEEVKDPLIHLLRNAVDHGVESPEARLRAGKMAHARLTLVFTQREGSRLELLVGDDGAGIDADRVRQAAVRKARLTVEEAAALSDAEAVDLIFESELSTREVVSRVSGRGLGLAIVREKAAKLGGNVSVESRLGEGTRFCIVVPSLLATFRGVLVEAAGRLFVLPTSNVACVVRVAADEIRRVEGRETIALGDRPVALVRLAEVLALPPHAAPAAAAAAPARTPVVVLGAGEQRIGFAVDAVVGEQEVLVKRFSRPLSRLRHIAAATVLGSGEVAPILDVGDLMKSARKGRGAWPRPAPVAAPLRPQSVLVAEDSITSRMLIRNVLESAGYRVRTAVDGIDAYTLLRGDDFDLVISDVEMPRLDGFGLTAKIRADRRLAKLPVILLTALESRDDRERGVDAGASAYLVKSGFDQSHLLETVRRLI